MKTQKVWFITGASRGFGFDIAKTALNSGDKVVATVRKNPEQLVAALNDNSNLLVVVLDVTKENQVKEGVQRAIAQFGKIDILVNNAGYGLLGATEEITDAEVKKQYDTNVFGLLNVTRAVLPFMRKAKAGHIINISSLFGYGASAPGFGIYGSTKFAVEGISEGLSLEVRPFGIHVTAVAPGLFSTQFASSDSYNTSEIVLDAYQDTVGKMRVVIGHLDGNQPGNPAKLAQVIIQLAESENPPLHLPVGKDAVAAFRSKTEQMEKEVAEWEEVASSTDHLKA
ncbi:oxidoreductase [Spirosoma endbachense]|uniref:SDR family NAD(P)-dependent oxidoreductase n=1 Tax=Spirosoma endbachense TaxID=2666025 RepID=A0A6P1W552_9BACT|nr:oxidoreductase [Spirosoma endbachense]QHW00582.1 SDR family NAD(P)-dependent oxidoreductase [Spirosoma endbachense]